MKPLSTKQDLNPVDMVGFESNAVKVILNLLQGCVRLIKLHPLTEVGHGGQEITVLTQSHGFML